MAATLLCAEADLNHILSGHGTTAFTDDNESGYIDQEERDNQLNFALEEGSLWVQQYTHKYSPDILVTNDWVRHAAAHLSACFLTSRRGNSPPTSLLDRCDFYTSWLEDVLEGTKEIPGLERYKNDRPFVSTLRVNGGWSRERERVRVSHDESVGGNGDLRQVYSTPKHPWRR